MRVFLYHFGKRDTAILTGRYVRSTFVEDQKEFVEHLQIGKQIGKLLDIQKRPQAHKHISLGQGGVGTDYIIP